MGQTCISAQPQVPLFTRSGPRTTRSRDPIFWIDAVGVEDDSLVVMGWYVSLFDGSDSEKPVVEFGKTRFQPVVQFARPDVINYLATKGLHGVTTSDAARSFVFVVPSATPRTAVLRFGARTEDLHEATSSNIADQETVRRFERELAETRSITSIRPAQRFLSRLALDSSVSAGHDTETRQAAAAVASGKPAADLWALGVVLRHFAATGMPDRLLSDNSDNAPASAWACAIALGALAASGSSVNGPVDSGLVLQSARTFLESLRREDFAKAILDDVARITAPAPLLYASDLPDAWIARDGLAAA